MTPPLSSGRARRAARSILAAVVAAGLASTGLAALPAAAATPTDCFGRTIPADEYRGPATADGKRYTGLQPYTATSPANHPMGSGARFESATGTMTSAFLKGTPAVNCDRWSYPILHATESDPVVKLTNVNNGVVRYVRIPTDAIPTAGTDRPLSIVQPDGITLVETYKINKISDTEWTSTYVVVNDMRTDGLSGGARASGISQVMGVIRPHEVANRHIPHPLGIGIPDSMLKDGQVWPSRLQDSNAATAYSGPIPMGTLLAIPPSVDVTKLGLSPEGLAVARALQDYGAYVLLRASTLALFVEPSSEGAAVERMRVDWRTLYKQLRVVTNSSATSIGGGGTPRQPLAAPLTTEPFSVGSGGDVALTPPAPAPEPEPAPEPAPEPEVDTTPSAPGPVRLTARTGTTLSAVWDPATAAAPVTDYQVMYRPAGTSAYLPFDDGVSAEPGAEVTGLKPGTQYDLITRAVTDVTGPWSERARWTTADVPAAPGPVTVADRTTTSVDLTWTAPTTDNGAKVTDYSVRYRPSGATTWTTATDGVSATPAASLTGLTPGTTYDVAVSAVNAVGSSTEATAAASTLAGTAPSTPGDLAVTGTTTSSADLAWTAARSALPVTGYVVAHREEGTTEWSVEDAASTTTSATLTDLEASTDYEVSVSARNAIGTSAPATATLTTTAPPSAPGAVRLTARTGTTLSAVWDAAESQAPVTDYELMYRPAGTATYLPFDDGVSAQPSALVTGLQPGTQYDLIVRAVTDVPGAWSERARWTTSGVPAAPGTPAVTTRTGTTMGLSWTAPSTDNGATVTDYVVRLRKAGTTTWSTVADGVGTSTTANLSGLTVGTSYDVSVAAVNAVGTGTAATARVSTVALPGAPTWTRYVAASATTIDLAWKAPTTDGGSSITRYVVQRSTDGRTWTTAATTSATSIRLSGLAKGTKYVLRVAATNVAGTGTPSAAVTVTTPRR